jgi:nitrite reductase (NADH) large subunit
MRVIVVGNGLAGTIASKTLREQNQTAEIDLYAEEKHLYYPRPNLIEFMAGNLPEEKLFAFPEKWYNDRNLQVHLGRPAIKIIPDANELEIEGAKREKYDFLLLANGAHSFVPPIEGTKKKGVFSLRTLDDALEILDWIKIHPHVVIIGGGLLGLEIARAIRNRGADVHVVEFFDRLLSRQLDVQGAAILKRQIEDMGIKVDLGITTEEILGHTAVKGLRLKSGDQLKAETAVVAAGVRANIALAKDAGLEVDKGIIVDDYMQTSKSRIFAAGDNVQHKGRMYGIIPASFNQARTAAHNIAGGKNKYEGTVPSNTLKVVGLDVTSIGQVNPEEGTCEEYRKEVKEEKIYKKIVVRNNRIIGAIWMGTKENVNEINRLILHQVGVEQGKEALLEEGFDFSVL